MKKILKYGHYKKPTLTFTCPRCGTQFETDEWLPLHPPRLQESNMPSGPITHSTNCPICNYWVQYES
jgi:endogenous inhibitor of DNA gyrase (YacG/DUF329 family)